MPASTRPQATGTLDDLGTASLAARRLLEEAKQQGRVAEPKPLTMDAIQEAMNRTIQETIAPLIGARFGVEAGTKIAQTLFQNPNHEPAPGSPNRHNSEDPRINLTEIVKAGIEGRKADQEFIDKLMAARFEAELKAVEEARKGSERNDAYWQNLVQLINQNHERQLELVKGIYQAKEEAKATGHPLSEQLMGQLVTTLSTLLTERLTTRSPDPVEEAVRRAQEYERLRGLVGGGKESTGNERARLLEMQHELNLKRLDMEMQRWREEREEQKAEREERAKRFEALAQMMVGALGQLGQVLGSRPPVASPPPPGPEGEPFPTGSPYPPAVPPLASSNATLEV